MNINIIIHVIQICIFSVSSVFDKIGIEPQVQRIGKYKSFGMFNSTMNTSIPREQYTKTL